MTKQQQADPYKMQIGKWIAAMRTAPSMAALNQIKDEWINNVPADHHRRGELVGIYLCWRGVHRHGLFWPIVSTEQLLAEDEDFYRSEQARASQGKKGAA